MRRFFCFACILSLAQAAWAADLTLKVVDPQSALVPGASVLLLRSESLPPVAVQNTSANGAVRFSGLAAGNYIIRILAPGFAPLRATATVPGELSLQLRIAVATQNVVVSATRTPVPGEETGAEVSSLEAGQLRNMKPVDEAEALRFLPGATVGEGGWVDLREPIMVRAGDAFVAMPEQAG